MSLLTTKDEYVPCPYEISHRILLSRFQTHLVKCEQNYRKANKPEYVDCPFNVTHKVMKPSLNCHVQYLCPDRKKVDTFVCLNEKDLEPAVPLKDILVEAEISENWDDADDLSYNPEEHVFNKPILLNKQCVSTSQRKAFRMQERLRHQELEGSKPPQNNENKRPNPVSSRLPQTSSRIANVSDQAVPTPVVSSLNGLKISDTNKLNDDFITPKYAKGRGRGRITKN